MLAAGRPRLPDTDAAPVSYVRHSATGISKPPNHRILKFPGPLTDIGFPHNERRDFFGTPSSVSAHLAPALRGQRVRGFDLRDRLVPAVAAGDRVLGRVAGRAARHLHGRHV